MGGVDPKKRIKEQAETIGILRKELREWVTTCDEQGRRIAELCEKIATLVDDGNRLEAERDALRELLAIRTTELAGEAEVLVKQDTRIAELERENADLRERAKTANSPGIRALRAERDALQGNYMRTLDTFERWIRKKTWDEDAALSWINSARHWRPVDDGS